MDDRADPCHPSWRDYAWLAAPILVALGSGYLVALAFRHALPLQVVEVIGGFIAAGVWVATTLALIVWKVRREEDRESADGGDSQ